MRHRTRWPATMLSTVLALSVLGVSPAAALTAPQGTAVAKPDGLTFRLPWAPGTTHVLGDFRYDRRGPGGSKITQSDHLCGDGSQDCYALDIVDSDLLGRDRYPTRYPLTSDMDVYPLFPGTIHYAGYASGGFSSFGRIVYVETDAAGDGHRYGALYAHLSSLAPGIATGEPVAADQPIGTFGGTVSSGAGDGVTCDGEGFPLHLHFAVYQDASFCDPSPRASTMAASRMPPATLAWDPMVARPSCPSH